MFDLSSVSNRDTFGKKKYAQMKNKETPNANVESGSPSNWHSNYKRYLFWGIIIVSIYKLYFIEIFYIIIQTKMWVHPLRRPKDLAIQHDVIY